MVRKRQYYDLPEKQDSRNRVSRKGAAEDVWKEIVVQETSNRGTVSDATRGGE